MDPLPAVPYTLQVIMLVFKLCVQTYEGDWVPQREGLEIAIRRSAIVAIARSVDNDCTGVVTLNKVYSVVGDYDTVRAKVSSDLR